MTGHMVVSLLALLTIPPLLLLANLIASKICVVRWYRLSERFSVETLEGGSSEVPSHLSRNAWAWPYAAALSVVAFPLYSAWRFLSLAAYEQWTPDALPSEKLWTLAGIFLLGFLVLIGVRIEQTKAQFRKGDADSSNGWPWLRILGAKASIFFAAYWLLIGFFMHLVFFKK